MALAALCDHKLQTALRQKFPEALCAHVHLSLSHLDDAGPMLHIDSKGMAQTLLSMDAKDRAPLMHKFYKALHEMNLQTDDMRRGGCIEKDGWLDIRAWERLAPERFYFNKKDWNYSYRMIISMEYGNGTSGFHRSSDVFVAAESVNKFVSKMGVAPLSLAPFYEIAKELSRQCAAEAKAEKKAKNTHDRQVAATQSQDYEEARNPWSDKALLSRSEGKSR